jgi:CubicO group peptidase (beta-lactamase class C family)
VRGRHLGDRCGSRDRLAVVARRDSSAAHGCPQLLQSVDGIIVLDSDLLTEATSAQSEGWCPVLEREASFGLGFQPSRLDRPFGPNPGGFGHFGTGGALGFADPQASGGFGYVMNAVRPRWQSPRNQALIDALYACL